ncbi:kelch-like protein 5 [Pocillopora verrucosa]|uniref:kelch-like protein 5 n=1 Tax=Pocillopora verrucosa TaxID=203993 RepID=UPI0033422549
MATAMATATAEEAGEETYDDFKDELLQKLHEFRETNILCDTIIRAQGQDFPAHKCVLSAASPYFRGMFSNDLKEKESNLVELQDIKSSTLSDVLRYIYTGRARIDSSNAKDLVMTADYLIIPSLKTRATLFLEGTLNASNCLAFESFASRYNCESLKKAAVAYKMEYFVDVVRSEDFRLLDVEKVKELICMDEINVAKEESVYEAVMAWVKHDLPSRETLLMDLLKFVRLSSISKYRLRKILDEELISKDPICMKEVITALDLSLFPEYFQDTSLNPRICLAKYEQVVILTGGEDIYGPNDYSQCLVLSCSKWLSLPAMPPCSPRSAAVCGGQLYVMGEKEKTSVCCFNPNQFKWSTLDLKMDRKGSTVTSFNEELYVIGGEGSWHDVQIYDPVFNKWRQGGSMKTSRAGHSAVVLQEHIYVIAGHNGEVCLSSTDCYNPLTDQWTEISGMSKVRRCAAAVAVGRNLFVVGGFGDMTRMTIEPSCEIFDPGANQWSVVPSLSISRAASGIVSIRDTVYLFGGEDERKRRKEVLCCEIGKNEWHEILLIPNGENSFLQASLLKVLKEVILSNSEKDGEL